MRGLIFVLFCLVLFSASLILGDVVIKTKGTSHMIGFKIADFTNTKHIQGDKVRSETITLTKFKSSRKDHIEQPNVIVINRYDLGLAWVLYPDDSSYAEQRFDDTGLTPPPTDKFFDMQSIDSAQLKEENELMWRLDSVVSVIKPINGNFAHGRISYITNISVDSTKESIGQFIFEYFAIPEDSLGKGIANYLRLTSELAEPDKDWRYKKVEAMLKMFSIKIDQLGIDEFYGYPVRINIYASGDLSAEVEGLTKLKKPDRNQSNDQNVEEGGPAEDKDEEKPVSDSMLEAGVKKMIEYILGGGDEFIKLCSEVISIEYVTLPDSLFAVPAGYREK